MGLSSKGIMIDQDEINEHGAFLEDLEPFLQSHMIVQYGPFDTNRAIRELNDGHPIMLMLLLSKGEHKVLATGYDDFGKTILVHDPDIGPHHALGSIEPFRIKEAVYIL